MRVESVEIVEGTKSLGRVGGHELFEAKATVILVEPSFWRWLTLREPRRHRVDLVRAISRADTALWYSAHTFEPVGNLTHGRLVKDALEQHPVNMSARARVVKILRSDG